MDFVIQIFGNLINQIFITNQKWTWWIYDIRNRHIRHRTAGGERWQMLLLIMSKDDRSVWEYLSNAIWYRQDLQRRSRFRYRYHHSEFDQIFTKKLKISYLDLDFDLDLDLHLHDSLVSRLCINNKVFIWSCSLEIPCLDFELLFQVVGRTSVHESVINLRSSQLRMMEYHFNLSVI